MADPRVESVTQRLRNEAAALGVPVLRVRQRYVFSHILARLAEDPSWTLKGGFALELRLGLRARATKDLDLVLSGPRIDVAEELEDALQDALESTSFDDGFVFDVRRPRPHRAEDEAPNTWRVIVDSRVHGSRFQEIPLDIVNAAEVNGAEMLPVRDLLGGSMASVRAISVARHAAEKIHAISRLYAYDRPSSRVKDLVDLVLLEEAGELRPDEVRSALEDTFRERNAEAPPSSLPDPPRAWEEPFAALAEASGLAARDLTTATARLHHLYARVSAAGDAINPEEHE